MAQYNSTTLAEALKEYYDREQVHDTVYEDNPWFGMIRKEQTGGKHYDFPVQYEVPGSRSRDISKVLSNKKVSKYVEFNVETVDDFASISIGRKVMKQTSKDEYAFFEAQQREVDKMLKSLVRSLSMSLYRNSGGAMGKVGSVTTTTITLDDIDEVANFGVGDEIAASANDGETSTDTLRSGTATITAINRDTGVLTTDSNWTSQITGLAASDFLFKDGDFQNSVTGLAGWCPSTAPSAGESFHGADRSVDVTRLAGVRISAQGDPITEAIMKGCARLMREGANPDCVLMNPTKLRDLIIELGNKAEYVMTTPTEATVGFQGVRVVSPNGSVVCYGDHNCPRKKAYVIRKDAWKLIYLGDDVPEIQDEDGSILCRESSSDGFEVRASYYANSICLEPNQNAVLTLES